MGRWIAGLAHSVPVPTILSRGKSLAEVFLGHRTQMAHEVCHPKESETTEPPKEPEQRNGELPENSNVSTMPYSKDTHSTPDLTRIRPLYRIGIWCWSRERLCRRGAHAIEGHCASLRFWAISHSSSLMESDGVRSR